MDEFRTRVINSNAHVVGVTETKPKNANFNLSQAELQINGYNIFTNSLVSGDGNRGCALYLSTSLQAQQIELKTEFKDSVWVEVDLIGRDKMLIGCVYRSPNSSHVQNAALRDLLEEAGSCKYSHVFITGDFNFPKIDWDTWSVKNSGGDDEESLFIEAVRDGFFHQHVKQNTRIRGTNEPSLLDLILTNEEGMVSDLEVQSPVGKSDHAFLVFDFHCYNLRLVATPSKFQFNSGDYVAMRQDLSEINWDDVVDVNAPVNTQWKKFAEKITTSMEHHIPKKAHKPGKHSNYLTPLDQNDIRKIKRKHRAWTRYMESRESKHYKIYVQLRNQVRQLTRKARIKQEKSIASEAKTNPKKFWKFTKSQTKTKDGVSNLKTGNNTTDGDGEKAEVLLNQFSSAFTVEPDGEVPNFPRRNIEFDNENVKITEEMVNEKLSNLIKTKSAGPDGIHPRVFWELSDVIAKPLTTIFNSSLQQREIPNDWRVATISPIFKKGNKQHASNYRPISLTCIASKIMESFIRDHMINHLKRNNLLSNKQFGFLRGRSTVLQLLKVLDNWTETLNISGAKIDSIYMDFQKAFDKVPHKRLLTKVNGYGLNGEIHDWIRAFLSNRSHKVCVNGEMSSSAEVTSGIPQGSVLGPALFVLYINDLPDELQNEVYLFADDTKIFSQIRNVSDAEHLQDDINLLGEWSRKWLLSFHPDKCKVLHLGKTNVNHHGYSLDGVELATTECEKDLGVSMDNKLKFDTHINEKVNKANAIMGIIRRSFRHLDPDTFSRLYKALVRPHLEYAVSVWNPYHIKDIKKLEQVQRRATKQITGLKDLSYDQRLQRLKLPTLVCAKILNGKVDLGVHCVREFINN